MKIPSTALALLALLAAAPAGAQTIFRCGHEYSSVVACRDARTLVIAADVSDEQRAEARRVASREKALAGEMARDRRLQEGALKPALAASLSAAPRVAEPAQGTGKRPKKHKQGAPTDDDRDFIAAVPKTAKAKT